MSFRTCEECRHCNVRNKKVKKGVDKKGNMQYEYIPEYNCSYFRLTHATPQKNCDEFVGWLTIFEYLMDTQPEMVNELLSNMKLKVVNANNKCGFSIVGE